MVWRVEGLHPSRSPKQEPVTTAVSFVPQSWPDESEVCGQFSAVAVTCSVPSVTCVNVTTGVNVSCHWSGAGGAVIDLPGSAERTDHAGCVESISQVCAGPWGCHSENPSHSYHGNPIRIDCSIFLRAFHLDQKSNVF